MFSYFYFLQPTYNTLVIIINRRSKKRCRFGGRHNPLHTHTLKNHDVQQVVGIAVGACRSRETLYGACALPSVEIITTSKLIPLKLYIYIYIYVCNLGRRQSHDIVVSVCVGTVYNFISVTLGCRISFLYTHIYICISQTVQDRSDRTGLHRGGTGRAGR